MRDPKHFHRIRKAFQIAAGILASRAWGCGTCPPSTEFTAVYTPPANGDASTGDGGLPVLDKAECDRICGETTISCAYATTDASGAVVVTCKTAVSCGAGRRPDGWSAGADACHGDPVGDWLARVAELEAVSVDAFRVLERDLARLGAPSSLRRRARLAAGDEVRHARTMRRLASRRGGVNHRPKVVPVADRPAIAIAIENVVEGCVRETFAAFVATVQAERAADPAVRAAMTRIARDETRHAALAHAVDAWLSTRLSADERAAVARARREAIARLEDEAPIALGDRARDALGIPDAATMRAAAREVMAATFPSSSG
jgi:hypothetical protein